MVPNRGVPEFRRHAIDAKTSPETCLGLLEFDRLKAWAAAEAVQIALPLRPPSASEIVNS